MPRTGRHDYARFAAEYDRRWAAYEERSLALLRPRVAGSALGRVLDLGCGTGNLLPRLAAWGARVDACAGADLSPEMLAAARARTDDASIPAGLAACDAAALPFRDAAFDTVISASVLHYWQRPDEALREARRVMRPGGRLLLLDWAGDGVRMRALAAFLRLTGDPTHRVWPSAELADLVARAGFRVTRIEIHRISLLWTLTLIDATAP